MYYIDTETCGLHGVPVLLQEAEGEGAINLHSLWLMPVSENIQLIEDIIKTGLIGFNNVFDIFHITKWYNMLIRYEGAGSDLPIDHIDELAEIEMLARDGVVLKPTHVFDVMLHARKGKYQATMDRKPIRVRKVPASLARALANELDSRVEIPDIYFARTNNSKFKIQDFEDNKGLVDPNFKNLLLSFAPSSALKAIAVDMLGETVVKFDEVALHERFKPVEYGWAPFAKAGVYQGGVLQPTGKGHWHKTWVDMVKFHISHWEEDYKARAYARDDVRLLREVYKGFGSPAVDDDDSILSAMVPNVRWKGFKVDLEKMAQCKAEAEELMKVAPRSPQKAWALLEPHLSDMEKAVIDGTSKPMLEQIAMWEDHPAAPIAKRIMESRSAEKEVELYDKILQAGRFHPSLKVIGTFTSRMSGADGLNPQGIKRTKKIREAFLMNLDPEHYDHNAGDFDAFEVGITDARYKDPILHSDLLNNVSIHANFGEDLFDLSYDEIKATKGTANDRYTKAKSGVFSQIYGGDENTLVRKLGVTKEQALAGAEKWAKRYPTLATEREKAFSRFRALKQSGGIGSKITWTEPAEYAESMFGHRRYFTIENAIIKAIYDLANDPPKEWRLVEDKVVRRDRVQTAAGAVQSALFGCAFGLCSAIARAGVNHEIQSTGAQVTKHLQCELWKLQPCGISDWVIELLNIHDEVQSINKKEVSEATARIVKDVIEKIKPIIPLIAMDWKIGLRSWADK